MAFASAQAQERTRKRLVGKGKVGPDISREATPPLSPLHDINNHGARPFPIPASLTNTASTDLGHPSPRLPQDWEAEAE